MDKIFCDKCKAEIKAVRAGGTYTFKVREFSITIFAQRKEAMEGIHTRWWYGADLCLTCLIELLQEKLDE